LKWSILATLNAYLECTFACKRQGQPDSL